MTIIKNKINLLKLYNHIAKIKYVISDIDLNTKYKIEIIKTNYNIKLLITL